MALRPFNSIEGYSVGQDPQIAVIDDNGNVTATNLTVNGVSNLGPVGNVHITGGSTGISIWDGKDGNDRKVSSGIYLYQLRTNIGTYCKKMILVR